MNNSLHLSTQTGEEQEYEQWIYTIHAYKLIAPVLRTDFCEVYAFIKIFDNSYFQFDWSEYKNVR